MEDKPSKQRNKRKQMAQLLHEVYVQMDKDFPKTNAEYRIVSDVRMDAEGKPWGSEWNISVYNGYARHNAWSVAFMYNMEKEKPQAMKVYIFTIIPSVSYNVYF